MSVLLTRLLESADPRLQRLGARLSSGLLDSASSQLKLGDLSHHHISLSDS